MLLSNLYEKLWFSLRKLRVFHCQRQLSLERLFTIQAFNELSRHPFALLYSLRYLRASCLEKKIPHSKKKKLHREQLSNC